VNTTPAGPTLQQVEQAIRAAIDTNNGELLKALEPVCDQLDQADKQQRALAILNGGRP
jgi:hypothetical protein